MAMAGYGLKERVFCRGVAADLGGQRANQLLGLSPRFLGYGLRLMGLAVQVLCSRQSDQARY